MHFMLKSMFIIRTQSESQILIVQSTSPTVLLLLTLPAAILDREVKVGATSPEFLSQKSNQRGGSMEKT